MQKKNRSGAAVAGIVRPLPGLRKLGPKEPEDRIEASLVDLAESWLEDIDRLSDKVPLQMTAVPINVSFYSVRSDGDDAVFLNPAAVSRCLRPQFRIVLLTVLSSLQYCPSYSFASLQLHLLTASPPYVFVFLMLRIPYILQTGSPETEQEPSHYATALAENFLFYSRNPIL